MPSAAGAGSGVDVAYVIPSLKDASGWRSLSVGVVRAMMQHAGVRPLLFVSAADAAAAASLLPGCAVSVLPHTQTLRPTSPRGWPGALTTWMRARRRQAPLPSLVHSLEAYPTGLVGHWLAQGRLPHVITAAGTYAVVWAHSRWNRRSYERVLRNASVVLPISHGTADLMRAHFETALAGTAVQVLPPGAVDHAVPRALALERRPARPPVVLSVGAIKPRKGYQVSLRAFARVRREIPGAEYTSSAAPITRHIAPASSA